MLQFKIRFSVIMVLCICWLLFSSLMLIFRLLSTSIIEPRAKQSTQNNKPVHWDELSKRPYQAESTWKSVALEPDLKGGDELIGWIWWRRKFQAEEQTFLLFTWFTHSCIHLPSHLFRVQFWKTSSLERLKCAYLLLNAFFLLIWWKVL